MKQFILIILIILGFSFYSKSQKFQIDTYNAVYNKRDLTNTLLVNNKLDSIQLNELIINERYAVISLTEEELLLLIKGRFQELLSLINLNKKHERNFAISREFDYKADSLRTKYKYSKSTYDSLYFNIPNYLKEKKIHVLDQINYSSINSEEKHFLKSYLLFYLNSVDYCDKEVEKEMLSTSRSFLAEYPQSIYYDFVNKYIDQEFKESPWGTGAYFLSGQIIPTGDLSNYISNGIPINLGLSINFKRLYLSAGLGPGIGAKIKDEIEYQKTWIKGDKLIYSQGEIYLGYNLVNRKRIGLTPFFGLGGAGLSPYKADDEDEYYEDVDNILPNSYLTYGINIDYRWGWTECVNNMYRGSGKDYSYVITRLSLGYNNPQYDQTVSSLDGSLWFIKIGIAYQTQFKRKIKKRL